MFCFQVSLSSLDTISYKHKEAAVSVCHASCFEVYGSTIVTANIVLLFCCPLFCVHCVVLGTFVEIAGLTMLYFEFLNKHRSVFSVSILHHPFLVVCDCFCTYICDEAYSVPVQASFFSN